MQARCVASATACATLHQRCSTHWRLVRRKWKWMPLLTSGLLVSLRKLLCFVLLHVLIAFATAWWHWSSSAILLHALEAVAFG